MSDIEVTPVTLGLNRRYAITYNAGSKTKERAVEGVIERDYGRFYMMRLDDGTQETILKNDLYRDDTKIAAIEDSTKSRMLKMVIEDACPARRLKSLYQEIIDCDEAIRAGQKAAQRKIEAIAEIECLTEKFLEQEKISPETGSSEITK